MNYRALFTDEDTLQGASFTCRLLHSDGSVMPNTQNRYPALFVLVGSLTLFYDGKESVLSAGEMFIVDRKRFADGFCLPDTIVLEYMLPEALTSRFGTFPEPIAPSVPITGRLETWVEERLLRRPCKMRSEADELIDLLILYQSRPLRTILEPLREYATEHGFLRKLKVTDPEPKRNRL